MKKSVKSKIPKFQSLEEEREYWEKLGPLAEGSRNSTLKSEAKPHSGKKLRPLVEGHRAQISKPKAKQKRSSFLAVRLTGDELTRLRDLAARQGLGPSTFARLLLTSAINQADKLPKTISLDELKHIVEHDLPQNVKGKLETFRQAVAVGDPDNSALLIIDSGNARQVEEFTWSFIAALLSTAGVRVIMPEDKGYEYLQNIVKTPT